MTAASLRGQQLTDVVREKKVGTQVFAGKCTYHTHCFH